MTIKRRRPRAGLYGGGKKNPDVVVLCRCGAQWFGLATVGNSVLADHVARCGPPVGVLEFQSLGHTVKWPSWWKGPEF